MLNVLARASKEMKPLNMHDEEADYDHRFLVKNFFCNSKLDEILGSVGCRIQYFNTTFLCVIYLIYISWILWKYWINVLCNLSSRQYLYLSCVINNKLPVTEKVSMTSSEVGVLCVAVSAGIFCRGAAVE